MLGLWAFFGVFLFYPICFMVKSAFVSDGVPTLAFVRTLFHDPRLSASLLNSLKLGIITTLLTFLISMPLAWLMVRCNFTGKGLLSSLLLLPLVLPPFVGAIGLRQILARYGAVNQLLDTLGIVPLTSGIDWLAGGLGCVVVLQTLHLYPIMFLQLSAALANVDRSLEEAGQSLGSHGFRLFRTITLPLMLPGVFAGASLIFIWAFTDLGTPLIFDYQQVIPVQIFNQVENAAENPTGYAMVMFVLVVTAILFWTSKWWFERRRVETTPRSHVGERTRQLNGWQSNLAWFALGTLLLLAVLPHLTVIIMSIGKGWQMRIMPKEFTSDFFEALHTHELTLPSIRNSIFYAGLATGLNVILGLAIAYLLARRNIPGRALLDATAMLPLALPGIVMAFGYIGCFSGTWLYPLPPHHNPTLLLIISYSVRRLPYVVRACYAGFQQVSVTLEEASASLGAPPLRTLLKVTFPLIAANILAGGILCFAFSVLEVSDSLVLAQTVEFYPVTKAIWVLGQRITGDGAHIASALGVICMIMLGLALFGAFKILGRRMGDLFRV